MPKALTKILVTGGAGGITKFIEDASGYLYDELIGIDIVV